MRISAISRRLRAAAGVAVLGATMLGLAAGPASANEAKHTYYLALGDSLAAGYQTLPQGGIEVGHGYAQDIARTLEQRAAAQGRTVEFTDLGCPGETSGSMLNGGCTFPHSFQGAQIDAAVAYLKAHHGADVTVTLDIGANNVDGCFKNGSLDATCAAEGIVSAGKDLGTILDRLQAAAGPHTKIVGMNLYDPFLAAWMTGAQGQLMATASVPLANTLNGVLEAQDFAHGVPTADVAGAFSTDSFLPLVDLGGQQVPLNVARIMQWTNMSRGDIHANDTGYQVMADAFLAKI